SSYAEDVCLLLCEFLVRENSLVVELPELAQALGILGGDPVRSGRSGSGVRSRLLALVIGLLLRLLLVALPVLAESICAPTHSRCTQQGTTSSEHWHRYSCPSSSSSASPIASMSSGAAATILGPPTWGATA